MRYLDERISNCDALMLRLTMSQIDYELEPETQQNEQKDPSTEDQKNALCDPFPSSPRCCIYVDSHLSHRLRYHDLDRTIHIDVVLIVRNIQNQAICTGCGKAGSFNDNLNHTACSDALALDR
jgi:hypothetical protein